MRMMEWFDMVATDMGLEDKYPSPPVLGGAHKREWCRGKGLGDGMKESVNEEESEFGGEDLSLPACLLGRRRITCLLECVACVRLRAGYIGTTRGTAHKATQLAVTVTGLKENQERPSLGDGRHFFLRSSLSPSSPSRLPLRRLPPDGLDASIIRCTGPEGQATSEIIPAWQMAPTAHSRDMGRHRRGRDGKRREEEELKVVIVTLGIYETDVSCNVSPCSRSERNQSRGRDIPLVETR
jgi:hypothetical protein